MHAGSMEGWIGEPWIKQAKNSSTDYHDNMNAKSFEEYLRSLCRWCQDRRKRNVVFVMDNAKYHRREQGTTESANRRHKTLSTLNKDELIERLLYVMNIKSGSCDDDMSEAKGGKESTHRRMQTTLGKMKKLDLYTMAKKPAYALPLASEVIVQKYILFFFFFFVLVD